MHFQVELIRPADRLHVRGVGEGKEARMTLRPSMSYWKNGTTTEALERIHSKRG